MTSTYIDSHAKTCNRRNTWTQTYISSDANKVPIAFEFRCIAHGQNFWLAIPKTDDRVLKFDSVT